MNPDSAPGNSVGMDYRGSVVSRGLGKLVPRWIANRAIDVSIATDRDAYDRGEPVPFSVTFSNRLPVAVTVSTPTQRRWGWSIDEHLEASTERRYLPTKPATLSFRAGQTRRIDAEWNGRIRHTGPQTESRVPDPGEHELSAFLATTTRPSASTTITIR